MTKPWKLKKNSSNILLVLITLILIKPAESEIDNRFAGKINRDGEIPNGNSTGKIRLIVGNEKIGRYYFRSSGATESFPLKNVNRCLENFQLVVCLKMLLLTRINEAIDILDKPEMIKTDFHFLNGLISFSANNDSARSDQPEIDQDHSECGNGFDEDRFGRQGEDIGLNGEISRQILKLFRNRSLRINLLPDYRIDLVPVPGRRENDFLCFGYKFYRGKPEEEEEEGEKREIKSDLWEGRKKGGKKGGLPMFLLLPQMLMLGFLPFTLAGLKSMIMNSLMLNTMALNGAIFMTIRNLVFGPRNDGNVRYVNYGYTKDRQTQPQRPVLIVHSPAAFVKRPSRHHRDSNYHDTRHTFRTPESLESWGYHDRSREWDDDRQRMYDYRESDEEEFNNGRRTKTTEGDDGRTWKNDSRNMRRWGRGGRTGKEVLRGQRVMPKGKMRRQEG